MIGHRERLSSVCVWDRGLLSRRAARKKGGTGRSVGGGKKGKGVRERTDSPER